MARRKTLPESVRAKYSLSERLASLRSEIYGERGGPELARKLGLPVRTWYNYESGVTVPAEVILKIIELTSVEPIWLLHGRGPKFRPKAEAGGCEAGLAPGASVGTLLRRALHLLEEDRANEQGVVIPRVTPAPAGDEHADVVLLAVDDTSTGPITKNSGPRYLAARGEWLDAERECRCIRIEGDAMSPIVADGAYVAFGKSAEDPAGLDGKMVVAWDEGQPIVRWFQYCGRYAVLKAENPEATPPSILFDLQAGAQDTRFRRVLWINTPH